MALKKKVCKELVKISKQKSVAKAHIAAHSDQFELWRTLNRDFGQVGPLIFYSKLPCSHVLERFTIPVKWGMASLALG